MIGGETMPGRSPYFFDTEKSIIYEYVVNGAYLYCEGCELSRTTPIGQLCVLTQDFCYQNGELSANEFEHQTGCILGFPYCSASEDNKENDPFSAQNVVSMSKRLFSNQETSECIPNTPYPWMETHQYSFIDKGASLLCDPLDYKNSSKLFCVKGCKWIYVLTSGQTISDEAKLKAYEENRDELEEMIRKQFEELNTLANREKGDYEVRKLSPQEISDAAKQYTNVLLGYLAAPKDANGFVQYDDLGDVGKCSLSALKMSVPTQFAEWDEINRCYTEYNIRTIMEFNEYYMNQNYGSVGQHSLLDMNSDMIETITLNYIFQPSYRKQAWDATKLVFKTIVLPQLVGLGVGKLTTTATPWISVKTGLSPAVVRTGLTGVGTAGASVPFNFVRDENGNIIGVDWTQVVLDGAIGAAFQGINESKAGNEFGWKKPKKYTVNQGQQDKHIPGTNNYDQEIAKGNQRSILTEDPQKLLNKKAGTGQPIGNSSKERVDFGKVIGQYYDPVSGTFSDTTKGIIHYNSRGQAHIVPARP